MLKAKRKRKKRRFGKLKTAKGNKDVICNQHLNQ